MLFARVIAFFAKVHALDALLQTFLVHFYYAGEILGKQPTILCLPFSQSPVQVIMIVYPYKNGGYYEKSLLH